jgi:hypothetical protein
MPSPNWSDDDELLLDLRRALADAPEDDLVVEAARAAFAWRTVDADLELAQLVHDSYVDDVGRTRGPEQDRPRTLSFQGTAQGVDIELGDSMIDGQLVPPRVAEVTLMTVDGAFATTTTDEVGCFVLPRPPRGPVRLECSADGSRMATQWVFLRPATVNP